MLHLTAAIIYVHIHIQSHYAYKYNTFVLQVHVFTDSNCSVFHVYLYTVNSIHIEDTTTSMTLWLCTRKHQHAIFTTKISNGKSLAVNIYQELRHNVVFWTLEDSPD